MCGRHVVVSMQGGEAHEFLMWHTHYESECAGPRHALRWRRRGHEILRGGLEASVIDFAKVGFA